MYCCDYDLNNVIASNIRLQLAMKEQDFIQPMFSSCREDDFIKLFERPYETFQLSASTFSGGCCKSGCNAGAPRDVRTVPCDVLMSGYRPLEGAYCCKTCSPTDLEMRSRQMERMKPYYDDIRNQEYNYCRSRECF